MNQSRLTLNQPIKLTGDDETDLKLFLLPNSSLYELFTKYSCPLLSLVIGGKVFEIEASPFPLSRELDRSAIGRFPARGEVTRVRIQKSTADGVTEVTRAT